MSQLLNRKEILKHGVLFRGPAPLVILHYTYYRHRQITRRQFFDRREFSSRSSLPKMVITASKPH